ncbi:hypothetical protein ACFYST_17330 [Kitasatospora sp. NPDC004614]|uniref:hypothetical protein n=1 Tax=unclassified Kitasatospora TaxID=2633591 RepID=UPI0036BC446D
MVAARVPDGKVGARLVFDLRGLPALQAPPTEEKDVDRMNGTGRPRLVAAANDRDPSRAALWQAAPTDGPSGAAS